MRQRIESLEQFRALQADYMAARDAEKRKILVCCGHGLCRRRQPQRLS